MFGGMIAGFLTVTSMDCADKRLTQMFGQVYLLHFLMLKYSHMVLALLVLLIV